MRFELNTIDKYILVYFGSVKEISEKLSAILTEEELEEYQFISAIEQIPAYYPSPIDNQFQPPY